MVTHEVLVTHGGVGGAKPPGSAGGPGGAAPRALQGVWGAAAPQRTPIQRLGFRTHGFERASKTLNLVIPGGCLLLWF